MEKPSYYPPVEGEPVFNLMEAADVTASTTGRFYYPKNRQRLEELGASTHGGQWFIPRSALVSMGWLTEEEDFPIRSGKQLPYAGKEQPSTRESISVKEQNHVLRMRAEIAEARLADKDAEIQRLNDTIKALIEKQ
jgi:hypothetical protein